MCILCRSCTSAVKISAKLPAENKTEFGFELVCQAHLIPADFRNNEPLKMKAMKAMSKITIVPTGYKAFWKDQ